MNSKLILAQKLGLSLPLSVALFSVFVNMLMLTGPLFMLQVYDRVLRSQSTETLTTLLVLVVLLYALMGCLDYARGRIMARLGARFQNYMDAPTFKNAFRFGATESTHQNTSNNLRNIETIRGFLSSPTALAFFDIPWAPIFILMIFALSPTLGWVAVCGSALLILIAITNQIVVKSKTIDAYEKSKQSQTFTNTTLQSANTVQAQGMQTPIKSRWQDYRGASLHAAVNASDYNGFFAALTKSSRLLLQSIMLAAGAYLAIKNEITPGAMIAGSILMGRALAPIETTISQWPFMAQTYNAWNALSKNLSPEVEKPKLLRKKPNAQLSVDNLGIASENKTHIALQQINFKLEPGDVLGVIGKSGADKSTLARTLVGLNLPNTGIIRIDGERLQNYNPDQLGQYIGYLPQSIDLFSGSIAENISGMVQNPSLESVETALNLVGANQMVKNLPDSYDTQICNGTQHLSGGQIQRLGLARAVYNDPSILILDEPNAALDVDGSQALNTTIRHFKNCGKLVIIMTHRPLAISECNKLLYLEGGKQHAYGPRDKILNSIVSNTHDITKMSA